MIKRGLVISIWVATLFGQSNLEKGYDYYVLKGEGSIEDRANPKYLNESINYYQLALKEPKSESVETERELEEGSKTFSGPEYCATALACRAIEIHILASERSVAMAGKQIPRPSEGVKPRQWP